MRSLVTKYLLLSLFPSTALAQDVCQYGLTDVLHVKGYEVEKEDAEYETRMRLGVTIFNAGARGFRMVDGSIIFQDVLDRDILRVGIDPDLRAQAGETVFQDRVYSNRRLLDVEQDDVVVTVCVRGLVYSDGEVFKARN